MLIIKNQEDLERVKSSFNKAVLKSLELDVEIITTEFNQQSDEYGPLIIVINEDEISDMLRKFKVLRNMEHEEIEVIYMDEKIVYSRTAYILTDAGFIVYIKKER